MMYAPCFHFFHNKNYESQYDVTFPVQTLDHCKLCFHCRAHVHNVDSNACRRTGMRNFKTSKKHRIVLTDFIVFPHFLYVWFVLEGSKSTGIQHGRVLDLLFMENETYNIHTQSVSLLNKVFFTSVSIGRL